MIARGVALAVWSFAVWVLLTWMFTFEQLAAGLVVSGLVGAAFAPIGPVVRPWLALRHPVAVARLAIVVAGRMVVANVRLARRIWTPGLPLRSGMVIVPTTMRTDGGLTAVGLLTSLIVDNQLVDLDRRRGLLQYHAIDVPEGDVRAQINGPIERLLAPIVGPGGAGPGGD